MNFGTAQALRLPPMFNALGGFWLQTLDFVRNFVTKLLLLRVFHK